MITGHAIECRINAEAAERNFMPSPGRIGAWRPPADADIRVDTHCYPGYFVPPFYDSMIGKLIVHGRDRKDAMVRMRNALGSFKVDGVLTAIPFHQSVLAHPDFAQGRVTTRWVEEQLLSQLYQPEAAA